jgi:ketopantoate reductase
MRLLIYGADPLGAYLAAHFRFLNLDALWYADQPTVAAVEQAGGIQAIGAKGRRFARGVRVTASPEEAFAGQYDLVFMVMPGYAVARALSQMREVRSFFDPAVNTTFVSLHRGIGPFERIASVFTPARVVRGVLTGWVEHPLIDGQSAPEIFVRLPNGGVALGEEHPRSTEIAALLYAAYLPTLVGNGFNLAWSGLLWQLQGNAIAALLDVDESDIYTSPALWQIEYKMLLEAVGIMIALGVRFVDLPGAPVTALVNQLQALPASILPGRMIRSRLPSSLRDALRRGTPGSEAAYLNGAVALHANDLTPKLAVPINYALALTLEDIASGRALWSQFRGEPRSLEALINIATYR